MGRTSIDGLSMRPSSARRRTTDATVKNPQKKTTTPQVNDIVRPKKRARKNTDDFLSPVQGFETDEPDNSLEAIDDADWSDLLGKLDEETDELMSDETKTEDSKKEKSSKKDKKGKKGKKPKNKRKRRRIILAVVFGLLLILAVVVFIWGDAIISKLTGGRSGLWDAMMSLVSEEVPFETDANGRTNVLVFGTEGYDMGGTGHDGAQLTDSIMVVSFDQKTKDVALLSLPRDLKVRAACYAGKINEIYTCNNPNEDNEEAGANAMMEEIGYLLDVDFQYWAHVNWASLVDIIDTLGGITITLDEDINDYGWTGARAQAGVPITVNGAEALGFARARHGTASGDFTRGNTQQKIVEGIVQKIKDDGLGVTEIINLVNILGGNLRSNFSTDVIKTGVNFLSDFDMANIRNIPLVDYENNIYYVTTDTINGISYVVPSAGANNYNQIREYIDIAFSSNPAVREGAVIAVFNATETPGVAAKEQEALENDGYSVASIGDAPAGSCGEKYCVYMLDESKTATKVALEERYGVTAHGAGELPEGVWAGDANVIVIVGQAE